VRGDRRGAVIATRAGLRILDEHRATLGATDLRAHASGQRVELAELGLRIAAEDGRPSRILAWAEQGRASHLLLRPVRPPEDPTLAGELAELRATVTEIDKERDSGRSTVGLVQRQIALELQIRDYCRRQPGESIMQPPGQVSLHAVAAALGHAALLEFVHLDDGMHVVTVIDGRTRFRSLGTMTRVRELVNRIAFALRRLARSQVSDASRAAAVAALRHAAAGLDDMLLRPLAAKLADRPLVLVPTGPLQALPWSVLPSCAGRPVTVSPSAALWYAADRVRQAPTGRAVVAAGPGLAGARAEAKAVGATHRTVPLVDLSATVDAVATALDGADLAHLAAHGRVNVENPLFSALRLADGPLTAYDLERLRRAPRIVVLAACDTGRPVVRAGDELLGLSATFLSLGAQHIIASVAPVPDAETAPLMVAFHRLLTIGHSAATALASAQQRLAGEDTAAMAAAAGFVCMGADVTLGPDVVEQFAFDAEHASDEEHASGCRAAP
jgi:CHAT domain-containing protein